MKRIPRTSNVLGHARGQANSNHIDNSLLKELGWGGHSFCTGTISYGTIMHRQPTAVYISEKALVMVSVADGDHAFSRMTRHTRQEQNWEVKINVIEDIKVIRGGEFGVREFKDDSKERLRQRVEVRIRNCPTILYIDTFDSPNFARHLLASWHACCCSHTAGLGKVRSTANPHLAREYLDEVIKCYSSSHELKHKIEILDELAQEVLLDLEMKDVVFKHREMIVLVLASCHKALQAPSGFEEEVQDKIRQYQLTRKATEKKFHGDGNISSPEGSPSSSPRDGGARDSTDTFIKVNYDERLQKKLENTVMNRMHFFHAALRLFANLLFRSESVASRVHALSEGDPLSPHAWLEFLAPDLLDVLCKKLQCNLKANLDQFDNEQKQETFGVAPGPLESIDFSDENLFLGGSSHDRYCFMLRLRRSVSDYQYISTFEICRVAAMGIPGEDCVGLSRMHNNVFLARKHLPMGELWVRQLDFDLTLESLMTRIASLLDDIVLTERARTREGKGMASRKGPRAAGADSGIGTPVKGLGIDIENITPYSNAGGSRSMTGRPPLERQPSVPSSPGKSASSSFRSSSPSKSTSDSAESPLRQSREERRKKTADDNTQTLPQQMMPPKRASSPTGSPKRSKRDSFTMLDHNFKLNTPEVVKKNAELKYGPLETQEVLLYYCCQLLRQLAYDSPKVREVLANECAAFWPSIVVILDIIVPRNDDLIYEQDVKDGHDEHPDIELRGEVVAPKSGLGALLTKCLGSGYNHAAASKKQEQEELHESYNDYVSQEIAQFDVHSKAEKAQVKYLEWCPVTCYGPPRVNVNKYSWILLALSRRCIDECMNIMGLVQSTSGSSAEYDSVTLEVSPRKPEKSSLPPKKPLKV